MPATPSRRTPSRRHRGRRAGEPRRRPRGSTVQRVPAAEAFQCPRPTEHLRRRPEGPRSGAPGRLARAAAPAPHRSRQPPDPARPGVGLRSFRGGDPPHRARAELAGASPAPCNTAPSARRDGGDEGAGAPEPLLRLPSCRVLEGAALAFARTPAALPGEGLNRALGRGRSHTRLTKTCGVGAE